jgi:biotin synthase
MVDNDDIRHDWTVVEIEALLALPLLDLLYRAQTLHRRYQDGTVQLASLLSIKTGGCPEDCAYCPQSAHYALGTGVAKEALMPVDTVLATARVRRVTPGRRGSAWEPRGAKCATVATSTTYWRWCAVCARSAWRPASRSAC